MKRYIYIIILLQCVVLHALAHYNVSPYAYCMGDPVNMVDVDGRDVYYFDNNGNLFRTLVDEEIDQVVCVDANDNYIMGREYAYGTITLKKIANIQCMQVNGDSEGSDIFTFLADNTAVEWSQVKTNDPVGPSQSNFISTSNKPDTESSGFAIAYNLYRNGYEVSEQNHNHPSGSLEPSGLRDGISKATKEFSRAGTYGDAKIAKAFEKYMPGTVLNIYSQGRYQQYNSKGRVGSAYGFVNIGNLNFRLTTFGL